MIKTLEIAEAIDRNKQSNPYDEYCKKVLSNKQILAWLIKGCVTEFKDIPLKEIPAYIVSDSKPHAYVDDDSDRFFGLNTEDHSVYGAVIIFDILVGLRLPNSSETENIDLVLNVEAQASSNTSYPLLHRAIYYGSRLIARQKNRVDGFTNSNFQDLKKVYSIWIVMNGNKAEKDILNRYTFNEICDKAEYHFPKWVYDKLSIIMICPKREYDLNDERHDLMELLHVLFTAKIPAADKKCQLEQNYGIMMTKEIEEEVSGMCNLSQGVREEGRMEGFAEGLEKGIEKGREEGITIGIIKGQCEIVIDMMKTKNKTAKEVMDILGIDKALRPQIEELVRQSIHN